MKGVEKKKTEINVDDVGLSKDVMKGETRNQ